MIVELLDRNGKLRTMHELQAEIVDKAVILHNGNYTKTAQALRVGRGMLYRKHKR